MNMISNISSKYRDLVSKSVLISSGPPAVYQLKTKKEELGTLTRLTVGEKDETKTNKTILLVGETGTGKSTLVDALVNFTLGVKFEDNVWFQMVEEEKKSQTQSQTSDVIVYQIFGLEGQSLPYSLTIIDTPGYGDTRGPERDLLIGQRLLDLFRSEDGVHEVDAVALMMKAGDNKLSERQRYVFDSVMSLFGKDLEGNIVAFISHSNGITPRNALQALEHGNIRCARNEKNQPLHFLFDNLQMTERTEQNLLALERAWRVSHTGMSLFTAFLTQTALQTVQETLEVLNQRIRLSACIQNLQERVELMELKQAEIRQIQEAVQEHEGELETEELTVEVDEVYKEKEAVDEGMWWLVFYEGATCCTICEENCHHPGCTMTWFPKGCVVMKDGRCSVCRGKCPASDHVKEKWIYVTKTRRVQKTKTEMKEKYKKNDPGREKESNLLQNMEEELEHLSAEKSQLLEEAYRHVLRLDGIALNVNSVSTYVHYDFLIEKMKEEGEREKVENLQRMRNKMDEDSRSALRYMWRTLTGGISSS